MVSFKSSLRVLSIFFITFCLGAFAAAQFTKPRLGVVQRSYLGKAKMPAPQLRDFTTFYYKQTLDHFNYRSDSYERLHQRYMINFKHWGGVAAKAPILAYLGAEASIEDDLLAVGFLNDNAPRFRALIVFIEHRYYGESIPFQSRREAFKNAERLGYFNSAQALADYASVLIHIKKNLSTQDSPVIVIGGSYGGMLASWFRLKYPHIALGALASSAPILYFPGIAPKFGYYHVVSKDFKETSRSCYETIRKSWTEIDKLGSHPKGLAILSNKFRTCRPVNHPIELKNYLDHVYSSLAQYHPSSISNLCDGIDRAPPKTDILGRIIAGLTAESGNQNSCYDIREDANDETNVGWHWQSCSEMVMPIVHGHGTMFPPEDFNITDFSEGCKSTYGVAPRPHWATTYYGGHDIKIVLRRFASNIIFSNGLRDPYSSGGVLENISDSVLALKTLNGSHCLDIAVATKDDPEWLLQQRRTEVKIIEGWIRKYYHDLSFKNPIHA